MENKLKENNDNLKTKNLEQKKAKFFSKKNDSSRLVNLAEKLEEEKSAYYYYVASY